MEILFIALAVVVFCFGFVLLFGAPYLPAHTSQVSIALDLLDLKPGENFYELGCGDGKVLLAAAERGWRVVGYEMNPLLYLVALTRTRRYRSTVTVYFGNFWNANLKSADGVYVFLLDRFMRRLDSKLSTELRSGVRLASYTFKIPDKKPFAHREGVYVYEY